MFDFLSSAWAWLSWLVGHTYLVAAFALYLATMAARLRYKWPVITPVIAVLASMGAGQIEYHSGFADGRAKERLDWQGDMDKARAAERLKVAQELQIERSKRADLQTKLDEIGRELVEFTESSSAEGEAAAKRIIQLQERTRIEWEAKLKQQKNEAHDGCPKIKMCMPALLQRVPDEFVRE